MRDGGRPRRPRRRATGILLALAMAASGAACSTAGAQDRADSTPKRGGTLRVMIGDAPGDYKAARDNQALFFPINPGKEESSWKRLYEEALARFFNRTYAGDYEAALVNEFDACLPEKPSW